MVASRWTCEKKNNASETLFVEWVDGNPYSRWWFPMAKSECLSEGKTWQRVKTDSIALLEVRMAGASR